MKRKRLKKLKKIWIVLLFILVVVLGIVGYLKSKKINITDAKVVTSYNDKKVKNNFNKYSITTKDTKLYELKDKKIVEVGTISKNNKIILEKIYKDYYKIEGLDFYVKYSSVKKTDEFKYSSRYKKFLLFNNNIKTKEITKFYDYDDNLIYTINKSYEFKVIVKDDNKYGVEFNNQLLYVKSEDVEQVLEVSNSDSEGKSKVRTLTYHFIYNPEARACDEIICLTLEQLESHLKYLSENDYLTLTLDDLELYMDSKIKIPEKSIVLTFDDGTVLDKEVPKLFEEYDLYATLFVITSWVNADDYKSDHFALESHTHNMHNQYECSGMGLQGGGILCLPEEKIKEDLKTNQEKVGGSKYFAYPFFDYNDYAIRMLKESGYHMAFIGQANTDGYDIPGVTDKFKMPRKSIFNDITLDEYANEYLN